MELKRIEECDVFWVPVRLIYVDPAFNCRNAFTLQSVKSLADNIGARGLDFPLVLQRVEDTQTPVPPGYHWRLIVGFRRLMAVTTFLKWDSIKASIRAGITDQEAELLNLTENLERKDLNPLEEAEALARRFKPNTPLREIAKAMNRDTRWVHQRLRLMELPARQSPRCVHMESNRDRQPHPAAVRAKELLRIKHAVKEIELFAKLIFAGKFHASFNIVGTLSNRMSGGDGLNAQGIKGSDEVRCMFPLAWSGYELCGGDFDSFEVTIADAVYNDPEIRKTLTTKAPCLDCNGTGKCRSKKCRRCHGTGTHDCEECDGTGVGTKKIHALFGMILFDCSYEEVVSDKEKYKKGKSGVFAEIYGGNEKTLQRNLSISEARAKKAHEQWARQYKGIGKARERTIRNFCSMKQPGGIGTQVVWDEPAEYVESFLGFRRYFTLENKICRALFELARKPPKGWRNHPIKVVRSNRVQTAGGAVASALGYDTYTDRHSDEDYARLLHDWLNCFIRRAKTVWLSYNAKWTFEIGSAVKLVLGRHCGEVEAKPCVQVFTFGQHNHYDLGNNHRPLLRLRWKDAPLLPDAVRVPSWRQENGDKRADPRGRVPGDVFDFTRVTGNSRQRRPWHPTQLNEGLVERCIRLTTPPGGSVLDPFAGTGTTLRVCKALGNPCTLIEIDPGYCEKIAEEHGMTRTNGEWHEQLQG